MSGVGVGLTAPPPPPPPPPQAASMSDNVIAENIPVSFLLSENIVGSSFSFITLASKLFFSGVILIFVAPFKFYNSLTFYYNLYNKTIQITFYSVLL